MQVFLANFTRVPSEMIESKIALKCRKFSESKSIELSIFCKNCFQQSGTFNQELKIYFILYKWPIQFVRGDIKRTERY